MRDILLVDGKSDRLERIRKLAKALVDRGWTSIAHGSDKAIYSHPDYPDHAISLISPFEYNLNDYSYGYSLFYKSLGTGEIVYLYNHNNNHVAAIEHMINNIFPKHDYDWYM